MHHKYIILLLVITICTGCVLRKTGRDLETTFGSLADTNIAQLGSPREKLSLVRRSITGEYALYDGKKYFYIGEDYKDISVVHQFRHQNEIFAVLACKTKGGITYNELLAVSGGRVKIYNLESNSTNPFNSESFKNRSVLLMQQTDPNAIDYWVVYNSNRVEAKETFRISAAKTKKRSATTQRTSTTQSTASRPKVKKAGRPAQESKVRVVEASATTNRKQEKTSDDTNLTIQLIELM